MKKRPDYLRALKDPEAPAQQALPGMPTPVEPKADQPKGLDETEQQIWDELLAQMPDQVKAELNTTVFECLVRATVQYRDASEKVKQYGAVIKSPSGYPIQSPYVSHMNKQAENIRRFSAELGLTLASRIRAKASNKRKSTGNPFEGLKTLGD